MDNSVINEVHKLKFAIITLNPNPFLSLFAGKNNPKTRKAQLSTLSTIEPPLPKNGISHFETFPQDFLALHRYLRKSETPLDRTRVRHLRDRDLHHRARRKLRRLQSPRRPGGGAGGNHIPANRSRLLHGRILVIQVQSRLPPQDHFQLLQTVSAICRLRSDRHHRQELCAQRIGNAGHILVRNVDLYVDADGDRHSDAVKSG